MTAEREQAPTFENAAEALRQHREPGITFAEFTRHMEAAMPALAALMCPNSMSDILEREAGDGD